MNETVVARDQETIVNSRRFADPPHPTRSIGAPAPPGLFGFRTAAMRCATAVDRIRRMRQHAGCSWTMLNQRYPPAASRRGKPYETGRNGKGDMTDVEATDQLRRPGQRQGPGHARGVRPLRP